ncbi:hypothetical protein [Clostridium sp. Marseille-QA1073]
MSRIKEELIAILLVFINLVVTIKILIESFKIVGFNYKFILMLFLIGIILYEFYSKVLNKVKYRIVFTFILLAFGVIYGYKNKELVIKFFKMLLLKMRYK